MFYAFRQKWLVMDLNVNKFENSFTLMTKNVHLLLFIEKKNVIIIIINYIMNCVIHLISLVSYFALDRDL